MTEPTSSDTRRTSRRLVWGLAVLYLASLGAAYVLSMRKPESKDGGVSLLPAKADRVGLIRISGPIYDRESRGLLPSGMDSTGTMVRKWVSTDQVWK